MGNPGAPLAITMIVSSRGSAVRQDDDNLGDVENLTTNGINGYDG